MLVYILNCNGEPLMPCKPQKARKLLKDGKAKVVNRTRSTTLIQQEKGAAIPPASKEAGVLAEILWKKLYWYSKQDLNKIKKFVNQQNLPYIEFHIDGNDIDRDYDEHIIGHIDIIDNKVSNFLIENNNIWLEKIIKEDKEK